jgi:hypothetical protein
MLIDEPKVMASRMLQFEARRAIERRLTLEPIVTNSRTDMDEDMRENPLRLSDDATSSFVMMLSVWQEPT